MVRLYLLGKKGLSCLEGLYSEHYQNISEVVIGRDSGVINDYSLEIENFCTTRKIPFCYRGDQPVLKAKLKIAIGWRWLIDDLENLMVFHDSLLPKYRGFNPLVSALINGDDKIGASVIYANKSFDQGDIILQESDAITHPLKIEDAINKIANMYQSMLNTLFDGFKKKTSFKAKPQNEDLATYSLWRNEEDYIINWNLTSHEIQRFIYAVGFPYKGAKTKFNNQWLRIYDANCVDDITIINRTPGKVIWRSSKGFVIVCGKGLLEIKSFYDETSNEFDFKNKLRIKFG